jgi:hypothetical protein
LQKQGPKKKHCFPLTEKILPVLKLKKKMTAREKITDECKYLLQLGRYTVPTAFKR